MAKIKVPCTCSCHRQNGIVHISACCDNGYILQEIKDLDKKTNENKKRHNGKNS